MARLHLHNRPWAGLPKRNPQPNLLARRVHHSLARAAETPPCIERGEERVGVEPTQTEKPSNVHKGMTPSQDAYETGDGAQRGDQAGADGEDDEGTDHAAAVLEAGKGAGEAEEVDKGKRNEEVSCGGEGIDCHAKGLGDC